MSTQVVIPRRRVGETRVYVYNPSPFADDVQVMGHYFHFPPRGVGQCTCAHHQPSRPGGQIGDNQGVHAIYDWPRTEKGILITSGNREVLADAQRVADFIVSEECRGAKGFVVISGTAEEIAEQKLAADRNFVAFYLPQVEQVIANWEASVSDYRKNRPGDAAPRQPKVVREAYEFRDNYADALPAVVQRRLAWVCNICGNEANTEQDLQAVCRRRHPAQEDITNISHPAATNVISTPRFGGTPRAPMPAAPPAAGPPESEAALRERLGASEEDIERDASMGEAGEAEQNLQPGLEGGLEPPPPPPPAEPIGVQRTASGAVLPPGIVAARERKALLAEGQQLLDQAGKVKFTLSVADKKGLTHGDAEVIADVKARLSESGKKPKKDKPAE